MTSPATRDQPTAPYRETPAGAPDDRVRVALVGGSGVPATDDLYRLLRRRLLIVCLLTIGFTVLGIVVGIVVLLTMPSPIDPDGPGEWASRNWRALLVLTVSGVSLLILWKRLPSRVIELRVIEVACFGTMVAMWLNGLVAYGGYALLEEATTLPEQTRVAFVGRYVSSISYVWCLILTFYGALIPNTWRRCAAVVAIVAASPVVVFTVLAFWLRPLDSTTASEVLIGLSLSNTMSAATAVFACSRIQLLREQAADARELGQYVLREKLGSGGMGEVYRAEHVLLRRPCAIKVIRPDRAGDPKNLRRFEREVRATATLTHPNTVQIFDYGHAEDGTFYYVMELLPGLTLEELVARHGPLPPARAVHFLRQLCGALAEAHGIGLVHRDIKPGNVMVCTRGAIPDTAKLLDFGLVLPRGGTDGDKLTQDGAIAGTPAYMSPEQAAGRDDLGPRGDVYSLGALAYFLLTSKPPFADRNAVQMLAAHLYEEPAPPSARRPDLPRELDAVVLKCLAKNPADRFADMRGVAAALAACGGAGEWTDADAAEWWRRRGVDSSGDNPDATRTSVSPGASSHRL